mmetsp:Transcript_49375/g.137208  ORF Transcript_49375/g.137208 Transcript_49375/m.137208 type:complete len:214 (+) Transcript_49375:821-1462(+)
MANSSSIRFCTTSSPKPGRPVAVMVTSVLLMRLFFFTTSIHSYLFSGTLFSGTLVPASFFSPSISPSSGSLFSLFSLTSCWSGNGASPSASCSAAWGAGAASGAASSSAAMGAGPVPFSWGLRASPSPSAASSGSGGSSRFSFTISSYSSSSTNCAFSMLKVPCSVSFALTLTFFGSVCAGNSILKLPSSLGVRGSNTFSSANSAFTSKGPVL